MASEQAVYVCWVLGTSADFHTVHTTFEACEADLVRWCKTHWQPKIDGPMPDDNDKLIDLTFRHDRPFQYDIEGPIQINAHYDPEAPRAATIG